MRARGDDVSKTDSTMDEIQYNHIRPIDLLSVFFFLFFSFNNTFIYTIIIILLLLYYYTRRFVRGVFFSRPIREPSVHRTCHGLLQLDCGFAYALHNIRTYVTSKRLSVSVLTREPLPSTCFTTTAKSKNFRCT